MMKRAIVLAVAALFVVGVGAMAYPVYPGVYNFLTPPVVPFDPAVSSMFPAPTYDPGGNDFLYRLNAADQGNIIYDSMFPEDYGGMLLGDGFWYLYNNTANIQNWDVTGAPDGLPDSSGVMTDMWISLPPMAGGSAYLGCPFKHAVDIAKCFLTDGLVTKTWDQAATDIDPGTGQPWTEGAMFGYDAGLGGFFSVGSDPMMYDRTQLEAYNGYEFKTLKANLALIVPAY